MGEAPTLEANFTNLSLSPDSAPGTPEAVLGWEEGFSKGFHAGVTHVRTLAWFLLLSYFVQAVLLWIGARLDMKESWYTMVVPTYRHGAFVFRLAVCVALVTETYFLRTSLLGVAG